MCLPPVEPNTSHAQHSRPTYRCWRASPNLPPLADEGQSSAKPTNPSVWHAARLDQVAEVRRHLHVLSDRVARAEGALTGDRRRTAAPLASRLHRQATRQGRREGYATPPAAAPFHRLPARIAPGLTVRTGACRHCVNTGHRVATGPHSAPGRPPALRAPKRRLTLPPPGRGGRRRAARFARRPARTPGRPPGWRRCGRR